MIHNSTGNHHRSIVKRLILLALLAVAALLASTAAVPASATAASTARQCSRSISVTHSSNEVQAQMNQTCGHLYRAYADFSGDTDYGPWRARNGTYSVACDTSASCNSHPDGTLSSGGYQSHDGTLHRTFSSGTAQDSARLCNETVYYVIDPGASPPYDKTEWNINSCIWYERGFVHCENGRNFIFGFGGWITSIDLFSKAKCPSGYPFLAGAGHDTKTCSGCSITRHWNYGSKAATTRKGAGQ